MARALVAVVGFLLAVTLAVNATIILSTKLDKLSHEWSLVALDSVTSLSHTVSFLTPLLIFREAAGSVSAISNNGQSMWANSQYYSGNGKQMVRSLVHIDTTTGQWTPPPNPKIITIVTFGGLFVDPLAPTDYLYAYGTQSGSTPQILRISQKLDEVREMYKFETYQADSYAALDTKRNIMYVLQDESAVAPPSFYLYGIELHPESSSGRRVVYAPFPSDCTAKTFLYDSVQDQLFAFAYVTIGKDSSMRLVKIELPTPSRPTVLCTQVGQAKFPNWPGIRVSTYGASTAAVAFDNSVMEVSLQTGHVMSSFNSSSPDWMYFNAHLTSLQLPPFEKPPAKPESNPPASLFQTFNADAHVTYWSGQDRSIKHYEVEVHAFLNTSGSQLELSEYRNGATPQANIYMLPAADSPDPYAESWFAGKCNMTCRTAPRSLFNQYGTVTDISKAVYDGADLLHEHRWAHHYVQNQKPGPNIQWIDEWWVTYDAASKTFTNVARQRTAHWYIQDEFQSFYNQVDISRYSKNVDVKRLTPPAGCPIDPDFAACGKCCPKGQRCVGGKCQ